MIQTLSPRISTGSILGQALGQGIQAGTQTGFQRAEENRNQSLLNQALNDVEQIYNNPNLTQEQKQIGLYQALSRRPDIAHAIERNQIERAKISAKPSPGGISGQPTPPEVGNRIRDIISKNPNDNAEDLSIKFDEAGIPRAYANSYIESRRRGEEQKNVKQRELESEKRKEVLPLKQKIVDKALAAQKGIKNKENLLSVIDRNNLDDPTVAAVLENVPLGLGKRFLNKDTVEYKADLVDEFTDLRNIFQGQTRVKELDILEEKIADVYLTDAQKKAVIKSRINSLQGDIIAAETAAEIENEKPNIGVLEFSNELNKRMKPKLKELSERVIDDHKSIIEDAEKKKQYPLDINNSEDKEILIQILNEAAGDKVKARQIAEKKGYKIKKY